MIRSGTSSDLAVLAALHTQCFAEAWRTNAFAELLASPGTFALIACDVGIDCGFVLVRAVAGEAEILSVGVSPSARRKGIAARLIAAGAKQAAQMAAKKMFLEVGAENGAARSLYEKLGFRQVGTRRGYYRQAGSPLQDALVLSAGIPLVGSCLGKLPEVD